MDSPEIKIGSKVNEIVKCSQCKKDTAAAQAYRCKGKKGTTIFVCEGCKNVLEKLFKEETQNPNMPMAVILGVLAGLLTGAVWFGLTVLTNYQVGYVAIGVGFIIGYAVIWGAGKKRGVKLQALSAGITVVTLLISQYFVVHYYLRKFLLENKAKFPGYEGQWVFLSPFNPDVLKQMFSPIGLLIWAVGIYFAYSLPKPKSIA